MENLTDIINGFDISAEVNDIQPLGKGLINDTYLVKTEGDAPDYVLQRINDRIFKNPELLQRNIDAVTGHIRKKLEAAGEDDIDRKVLRFIMPKIRTSLSWKKTASSGDLASSSRTPEHSMSLTKRPLTAQARPSEISSQCSLTLMWSSARPFRISTIWNSV